MSSSLRGAKGNAAIQTPERVVPSGLLRYARNDIPVMLYTKAIPSPLGTLHLVASEKGLRYVGFDNTPHKHPALEGTLQPVDTQKHLSVAETQLAEYFAGKRTAFTVPLDLIGTVFQQKAWRALQTINYGETVSYGEQASRMGDKNKARAVGMANNRNPIPILIPCHRVVGSDGALVGYAGGLKRKEWLLTLEQPSKN